MRAKTTKKSKDAMFSKYRLAALINFLLALPPLVIIVTGGFLTHKLTSFTLKVILSSYAPFVILLLSVIFELWMIYKLVFKKWHPQSIFLYAILTITPFLWSLALVVQFFLYPSYLLVIGIGYNLFLFFFLQKLSLRLAFTFSIITLLALLIVILSGFEENYCWSKGALADKTGSRMVKATRDDVIRLKEFNVAKGTKIGVSFRIHMLCHQTFNLSASLKETYLPH